jgi:hypothetical protein
VGNLNQHMNLTSKDIRAIELLQQYDRQDFEHNLKEYHNLIDTLIFLNETLRLENTQIPYWQKYSETLLFKFCLHGLTLRNICSGVILQSTYFDKELSGAKIIDISSAKVVLRSQLETFLMYYYIYVNPANDDEKQLRYHAWIYSALLQRQNFPTTTEFGKNQKKNDLVEIERIKIEIQKLTSFKKLSAKQQKALLENGSGKLFNHWAQILKETGFSETHAFSIIYNYLSIYSHSEGLSAIQLNGTSFAYEKNKEQVDLDIHNSKLLVCLMITAITKLFVPVKMKYNTLPDNLRYDIEIYSSMAMTARH